MEKQVDKIIADKINSLTSLPEGYTPNLEAKWAMLQGEQKKENAFIMQLLNNWQKVAAAVLLLLISTVIWLNVTSTITITMDRHDPNNHSIDQSKTQLAQENSGEKTVYHKSYIRKTKRAQSTLPLEKKTEVQSPQEIIVKEVTQDLPLVSQEIQKPIVAGKVKKARYVQVDFDDTSKIQQDHAVYAQSVRFKLGINFRSTNKEEEHTEPAIKISSNF